MDCPYIEKMDMLVLVITALKDHEKRIDAVSERLEAIVTRLEQTKITVHNGAAL